MRELFLSGKTDSPRRRSLRSRVPQENTLCSFHFARAGFLFLLMKRVFSCGSLPSTNRAGGGAVRTSLGRLSRRGLGEECGRASAFFFEKIGG
ncbi:MAG: hypothetical protein CO088_03790 [Candidatus Yonathbacteria bacterium CG_4_9_14_0_8_um_filter_46_47]|uniref:Uncharacterized protein n=1 Tax=Candidatus Yonathbacteria bacterium CG_4_9_14_0_8_um_filter_46_47 TaxID=1975106 RepID=A0A2M8D619_9BACT|nr:MAG: hypothetical protein CO088_03790 [Candidatus Yonathbacteria bacterium CG_4_9_14_0_8_um_filter_46_47]